MTVHGSFFIDGSFRLTKHGLVIYGDIIDGTVRKQNLLSFINEDQEFRLRIKDINFLDRIAENITKLGLTFYYESDEQQKRLETLQVINQTAKIISD